MTDTRLSVSTRAFLKRWLPLVVLGFAVVALLGGYVTYDAHVDGPETVVEEQTTGKWTVQSDFEHTAIVQRQTDVFTSGNRLENRPLYFTTVSPELDSSYTISHNNTDGEPATASVDLSLVVRAVEQQDEQTIVHWRARDSLATLDSVEVADGTAESATASVNVPAVLRRIEAIREELGASPGRTEALIVADTTVETTLGGESFTDTRTDRIEITPSDGFYRVSTSVQSRESYQTTETVTRTIEPSLLALYGGPAALLVGVVGIVGTALLSRRDWLAVSEREAARREFERARTDLDEWISSAEIPAPGNRTVVHANSLPALVDIAIDSDRRVLESDDRYAVIVGDILYTYTAPTGADPLDGSDGTTVQSERDATDGNTSDLLEPNTSPGDATDETAADSSADGDDDSDEV